MTDKRIMSIVLLLITTAVLGQNKSTIKINGNIDPALTKIFFSRELVVKVRKAHQIESTLMKVPIAGNGSFKAALPCPDSLVYLTFNIEDNRQDSEHKGLSFNVTYPKVPQLSEAYLFQPGDSISMDISLGKLISFHGRGSEKLNCQAQIYNLEAVPRSVAQRAVALSNLGELEKRELLVNTTNDLSIGLRLGVLKSYRTQISRKVYDLLYLDAVASAQYYLFKDISGLLWRFPDKKNQSIILEGYELLLNKKNIYYPVDSASLQRSAYYADMLFQKELSYFILFHPDEINQVGTFKEIYDKIKQTYSGRLKDKLLLEAFVNVGSRKSTEAKQYVSETLEAMANSEIKQSLIEWKEKQYSAYPFILFDANNKVHRLIDYKGKLIVIDVWFTGCLNCISLAKAMHPIIEDFKNNDKVVFLTISPDPKNRWLESVSSGKYTSRGTINLHTNGLGWQDPMFMHYSWNGAPNQLIINPQGELITSSPPRADVNSAYAEAFKGIVDAALKQYSLK